MADGDTHIVILGKLSDTLRMPYPTCFNPTEPISQILKDPVTNLNDISECLLKNKSKNVKDFHLQDCMHSSHFGSISETRNSILFFLFTQNLDIKDDNERERQAKKERNEDYF